MFKNTKFFLKTEKLRICPNNDEFRFKKHT